ncbi:MAG TPA: hypothetical protein DCY74_10185 [Clostridiales bacterium]|jgi:hypothetical protein|nr:hypothetical protein [Clostridiales bacterium]
MKNDFNRDQFPNIDAPEGLKEKIKESTPALAKTRRAKKIRAITVWGSAAAVFVLLCGIGLIALGGGNVLKLRSTNDGFNKEIADHIGEYSDKIGDDTAVAPLYPGSSDGSREYDSEYPTGDYVTGGVSEPGEGMIVPPVGVGGQPTQSGTLTAGEWCDNENFDFFLNLLQKNSEFQLAKKYFGISPVSRITVTLDYGKDHPAKNRRVQLLASDDSVLWQGVTDNQGVVYLYLQPFGGNAVTPTRIAVAGQSGNTYFNLPGNTSSYTFTLSDSKAENKVLDLMLLCDTTGSMGDELEYLKVEMDGILRDVAAKYNGWTIRFSVSFYRDIGDAYVVKTNPFSSDLNEVLTLLRQETASGGGDTPEAVHTALYDSLNKVQWDSDADAKLMVLILDAPSHEGQECNATLQKAVEQAAKEGVRIIGVAGSDTDKNAEYMLRSMSILTGGSYVFLTNHSGVGNHHMEPTVGQYEVKKLNVLLVEIISRYLQS